MFSDTVLPPSIDLHAHLRGTMNPARAIELAKKNNVELPTGLFAANGEFQWKDFDDFLYVYDRVGHVVRRSEDIYDLAKVYLLGCSESGTIYIEFMISPTHSVLNGIPFKSQLTALTSAIEDARAICGIEAGIIVTCVRHRGPEEAKDVAETLVANLTPSIVGFGLTGNERLLDAREFQGAFLIADEAGLGLTAHTGEWGSARSILYTVNELRLSRIGHGIRAVEDAAVLAELAARNVGFEVCLSSNIALGAWRSLRDHPLPKMLAAGCRVSLATDDPAYFRTCPENEYKIARDVLHLSANQLERISFDAIDMAFCDEQTKSNLRHTILKK